MIEKQKTQRLNQEKIMLLYELQKKCQKEMEQLQELSKQSVSKKIFTKTPSMVLASGVITFATSYAVTKSMMDSMALATAEMTLVSGSACGISCILKPDPKRIERLKILKQQVNQYGEELTLRNHIHNYLSYGIIFASKGYFQKSLSKKFVEEDLELQEIIQKIILQIMNEELLEMNDPEQYNELEMQKEEFLDRIYPMDSIDKGYSKVLQ